MKMAERRRDGMGGGDGDVMPYSEFDILGNRLICAARDEKTAARTSE